MYAVLTLAISCLKLILIPSYKSTDFEVHRNWLAITHSLPLAKWYTDVTSEWTLDYPPLFALFEWFLAKFAKHFDEKMLKVTNLNYASYETVLFQRFSVIITDLVFAYGCKICIDEVCKFNSKGNLESFKGWLFVVVFGNAGLLLVDHIHFQYNGFLFGILFISLARMLQGRELESAFWFAVLLNLKHIYLYIAPAYFVYLLRSYCLKSEKKTGRISGINFTKFIKLSLVVVTVFAISFGPFVLLGQGKQVLSRLFPFKRGLSHAYWAPNFWAVYNFADKVLSVIATRLGYSLKATAHLTGGLVEDVNHAILPSVSPLVTFAITSLSMMPSLWKLWLRPNDKLLFLRAIIVCSFCSFMFGWHVHEKAILMIILPMSLLILHDKEDGSTFFLLSVTGHFSLFPLIFTKKELIIKISVLLLHAMLTFELLTEFWVSKPSIKKVKTSHWSTMVPFSPVLVIGESLYIIGILPLFLISELLPHFLPRMEYLPLLLISVYSSLGVLYSWIMFYASILRISHTNEKIKKR